MYYYYKMGCNFIEILKEDYNLNIIQMKMMFVLLSTFVSISMAGRFIIDPIYVIIAFNPYPPQCLDHNIIKILRVIGSFEPFIYGISIGKIFYFFIKIN